MNYKYVISFLGSKQQKDWAKPVSEWMACRNEHKLWDDEFMEAIGIKSNIQSLKMPSYFAMGSDGGVSTGSTELGPSSYPCYWNPNYRDIFIIITSPPGSAGLEERLKKLEDLIESDPTKARDMAARCERLSVA